MGLWLHMRKIPLGRNLFEPAVAVPRPAVKRTGESGAEASPFATNESSTTVGATVSKGVQVAGLIAGNNDRVRTDVINIAITRFRNVLFAAGPLPSLGPHFRDFFSGKAGIGIALCVQIRVTEKIISRGK